MNKLRVADILGDSICDGPGLRTVVFAQGCERKCKGCHNPQTWDKNAGTEEDVVELYNKIVKNPMLCGVTFSGGEPFLQAEGFIALAKLLKKDNIEIAAYTGFLFEELIKDETKRELLNYIDTLIDGQFVEEKKSLLLKFRGSSNQRIIDVKKSLEQGKVVLDESDRWN